MLRNIANPTFSSTAVHKIKISLCLLLHQNSINCRYCFIRIEITMKDILMKKIIFCQNCSRRYSLSVFTPLYRMKIPMPCFYCLIKGFLARKPPRMILKDLNFYGYHISELTIYKYLLMLRKLVTNYMSRYLKQLKFQGDIEIDECVLTSSKTGWGTGRFPTLHLWIFGLFERNTKRCIVYLVPNRRTETLFPIIREHAALNSRIISDDFSVYVNNRSVPRVSRLVPAFLNLGVTHRWVNHSLRYRDDFFQDVHTNNVERLWRSVREYVPTNCSFQSLNTYIKSFIFLKNFSIEEQDRIIVAILKSKMH
jgi:hypothetical protein